MVVCFNIAEKIVDFSKCKVYRRQLESEDYKVGTLWEREWQTGTRWRQEIENKMSMLWGRTAQNRKALESTGKSSAREWGHGI